MSPGVLLAAGWLLSAPARAAAPGPPAPALLAPAPGATVSGTVILIATTPTPAGLGGIQFLLDGAPLGAPVTSPPYRLEWDTTHAAGDTHMLTAAAFDASGARTASPGITILVDNAVRPPAPASVPASTAPAADTAAPIVLLMNPAPGAVVSSTITISVNASDNVAVSSVDFLLDGVQLTPSLSSAPYTLRWNSALVRDGNHTLAAIARDAAGNAATSVVTLSVENVAAVITSVVVSGITASGASLIWKTDKPADSSVDYGPTPAYGANAAAPARAIGHAVALKGLAPATVYHYRVRSRAAGGLLTLSEDGAFTTGAGAAAPAAAVPAAAAATAKAPQKFLSPAQKDGINDEAAFGPAAREVTIFDVRGRKIFHAGAGGPGAPIVWKCRDDSGRLVESGIYVARILTQDAGTQYQTFAVAK